MDWLTFRREVEGVSVATGKLPPRPHPIGAISRQRKNENTNWRYWTNTGTPHLLSANKCNHSVECCYRTAVMFVFRKSWVSLCPIRGCADSDGCYRDRETISLWLFCCLLPRHLSMHQLLLSKLARRTRSGILSGHTSPENAIMMKPIDRRR